MGNVSARLRASRKGRSLLSAGDCGGGGDSEAGFIPGFSASPPPRTAFSCAVWKRLHSDRSFVPPAYLVRESSPGVRRVYSMSLCIYSRVSVRTNEIAGRTIKSLTGSSLHTFNVLFFLLLLFGLQASYLVGVSDPHSQSGHEGLVDPIQFARAHQAIQMACQNLVDPASSPSQVSRRRRRSRSSHRPIQLNEELLTKRKGQKSQPSDRRFILYYGQWEKCILGGMFFFGCSTSSDHCTTLAIWYPVLIIHP